MADEPIDEAFGAPRTVVFEALRQTVADLGYKDVREDPAAGTIEFRTGLSWSSWRGQEMTATVREAGPDSTVVSLAGGRALKVQATSWGEKKRMREEVLSQVEQRLGARPPAPPA